jgi:hypothetical protein
MMWMIRVFQQWKSFSHSGKIKGRHFAFLLARKCCREHTLYRLHGHARCEAGVSWRLTRTYSKFFTNIEPGNNNHRTRKISSNCKVTEWLICGCYNLHCKRRAGENPVCLVPIYVFPEIKLLFPKQNYNVLSPSSCTHISVRDLYIFRIGPILLQWNMWTDPGKI